jgi:hypothetical protein
MVYLFLWLSWHFLIPAGSSWRMYHYSQEEQRFYCLGRVTEGILSVRFTYRNRQIRIIGAGYWRKGKRIYEKQNKVH